MLNKFDRAKYVKREVRRARWITARVIADGLNADCHVMNISQHGATLVTDLPRVLPLRFELSFSHNTDGLRCAVVWRRGRMVGVRFV